MNISELLIYLEGRGVSLSPQSDQLFSAVEEYRLCASFFAEELSDSEAMKLRLKWPEHVEGRDIRIIRRRMGGVLYSLPKSEITIAEAKELVRRIANEDKDNPGRWLVWWEYLEKLEAEDQNLEARIKDMLGFLKSLVD